MRIGPYEIEVKLSATRVDYRPIQQRWPWLQRWTGYKFLAVLQIICLPINIFLSYHAFTTQSFALGVLWGIACLSVLGVPHNLRLHKAELIRKTELSSIYNCHS